MDFNLKQFYKFCSELKIETKEQGLRKMDTLLGTQTYVMDEIAKGLADDVHFFVILKGRQLGITTISLALDLYRHFLNPGLQGTLLQIQKKTEICSAQLSPCTWRAYQKNLESHYSLTTEISFLSKTEADSFIKWLDSERKAHSVEVKLSPICTELKPVLGEMKKD